MWILCVWPHSQGRSCSHFGRPRFWVRRKSMDADWKEILPRTCIFDIKDRIVELKSIHTCFDPTVWLDILVIVTELFGRPRFGPRRKSIGKKYCQGLKTSPLEALNGHILNKHIFTHIFTQQSGWTYWWPIYLWYRIYVNQTVCHQPKQSPILMLSNVYARTRCCVTGPDIALLDMIFCYIGHLISNSKFWSLV